MPYPRWGFVGLALVAICWPLNWMLPGPRTHLLFFPLWLGAILCADGLVFARRGTSPVARGVSRFARLFVLSIPVWWLFEAINARTHNWIYVGRERFGDLEYALYASLSFSTVVPAVFVAAELVLTFGWIERFARGPRFRAPPSVLIVTGLVLFGLLMAWPRVLYPLVWVSLVLVADPVCERLGRTSMLAHLGRGDWRRFAALWVGTLGCGVLWEMWNIRSDPKWIYDTPGVEFLYVFEMPLLGYLGYLPFGLEAYALTHLLWKDAPDLPTESPS